MSVIHQPRTLYIICIAWMALTAMPMLTGNSSAQAPEGIGTEPTDPTNPPSDATMGADVASTQSTMATEAVAGTASPTPTPPPQAQAEQAKELGIITLFKNGGPVMWPLLVSLLVAIGFAIERGIVLGRGRVNVLTFMRKVDGLLDKSDVKAAIEVCETTRGPVAQVVRAGLARWEKGRKHVEKAIETAGAGAMSKLERGLPVLASIANIAPLLGFLGTVTGMIKSFGVIAQAGLSNPGMVAKGISEALITTASGLIIAIPTLAAYNFFTSVVARSALEMDESTSQLLDRLK